MRRDDSPDGWTRQLELEVAVSDPAFWTAQSDLLNDMLRFLTTDIWNVSFMEGGVVERTIAWLNRCRRLAKDWENLNRNALAFIKLASIRLMLRKLCNPT